MARAKQVFPQETRLNLWASPLLVPNYHQQMALCISKQSACGCIYYWVKGEEGKHHMREVLKNRYRKKAHLRDVEKRVQNCELIF